MKTSTLTKNSDHSPRPIISTYNNPSRSTENQNIHEGEMSDEQEQNINISNEEEKSEESKKFEIMKITTNY